MTDLLIFVTLNVAYWGGVGALVADHRGSGALEDTLAVAVAGFACMVVALEVLGTIQADRPSGDRASLHCDRGSRFLAISFFVQRAA